MIDRGQDGIHRWGDVFRVSLLHRSELWRYERREGESKQDDDDDDEDDDHHHQDEDDDNDDEDNDQDEAEWDEDRDRNDESAGDWGGGERW